MSQSVTALAQPHSNRLNNKIGVFPHQTSGTKTICPNKKIIFHSLIRLK